MACDTAIDLENNVRGILSPNGLLPLGWFDIDGQPALLIGNVGSSLWSAFSKSDQLADGKRDPMNRWTEITISAMVDELRPGLVSEIRYPFGEPNWPFQDYARQGLGVEQSPIGLLIHPKHGLWTAYRAVLVFEQRFEVPKPEISARPCDSCLEKPCLNTCPIGAFAEDGYDYIACKAHVASEPGRTCLDGGCLARQACPVGRNYSYERRHQAFHMKAYI